MDISVETTKSFEKDINELPPPERKKVKEKLNTLIADARENKSLRQLYRLHKIHLQNNLNSSLFIFRVNINLRVILTFENDPIFSQAVMTLHRLARPADLDKVFKSVSESLY